MSPTDTKANIPRPYNILPTSQQMKFVQRCVLLLPWAVPTCQFKVTGELPLLLMSFSFDQFFGVKNIARSCLTYIELLLRTANQGMMIVTNCASYKSNHRRCSSQKAVLKNFALFTEKNMCCSGRPEGLQLY